MRLLALAAMAMTAAVSAQAARVFTGGYVPPRNVANVNHCAANTHETGNVTVSGAALLRDGVAWMPKGVNSWGLAVPRAAVGNIEFGEPVTNFSTATLDAMVEYGADAVRFVLAEHYLDPQNAAYAPAYFGEIVSAVTAARARGLVVALVIQSYQITVDATAAGTPSYASDVSVRVWRQLSPYFRCDRGVIFDIKGEPVQLFNLTVPTIYTSWARSHQPIINEIRKLGATNALMVEPMLNGAFAASATIGAGGTGYASGDIVSIPANVNWSRRANFRVTAPAGVVTAAEPYDPGVVNGVAAKPVNPVTMAGGSGTGLTLNITWDNNQAVAQVLESAETAGFVDPLNSIIYSPHVYTVYANSLPANYDAYWADLASVAPVIIGEWTNDSTIGCDADLETYITDFLTKLQTEGIGMFAWQFDRAYHLTDGYPNYAPTTLVDFSCAGGSQSGPGLTVREYYRNGTIGIL